MLRSHSLPPAVLPVFLIAGCCLFVPLAARAQQSETPAANSAASKSGKAKPSEQVTIHIEVTAGDKDKPVDSASVYVRYNQPHKFKSDRLVEMNVKTSQDGKVRVQLVPKGKILIQVIAPGWKTFGRWFELTEDEQVFKIHLDNPPKWY